MSSSGRRKRIVVVGSGFGGLAAALRLQTRGYDVLVLESRDRPGGRAYVYEQDGFRFDAGPTVITAPFLIHELFEQAGRNSADFLCLRPIDPFYRIELPDGRSFEYTGDEREMERRLVAFAPGDLDGYRRMLAQTQAIFRKGFIELADRPFLRFRDMLRIVPDLARLQSYRSVHGFVSRYIRDPMLRRVFSFHPLLVGGNPFQTTSVYALIQYLERKWGVHYVMGGTGALVSALVQLFCQQGGELRLSCPVERVLVRDKAAVGVVLAGGESVSADAVVSNADVANTYRRLLAPETRRKYTNRRLESMRYSMSLFVIYFGTSRSYPDVRHHTIILTERYRALLDDIFNRKILPEDFSLYLHRPTATDPSVAPPGCECFYALIPVPNQLSGIDWRREARPFRNRVMEFLEQTYLPGLRSNLRTELLFTPLDFETTLASYRGSAFSFEPVLRQSAWFRPHNESEDVKNLFFVGAGTHPGAGLPGVLSSAKIAEQLICERLPV